MQCSFRGSSTAVHYAYVGIWVEECCRWSATACWITHSWVYMLFWFLSVFCARTLTLWLFLFCFRSHNINKTNQNKTTHDGYRWMLWFPSALIAMVSCLIVVFSRLLTLCLFHVLFDKHSPVHDVSVFFIFAHHFCNEMTTCGHDWIVCLHYTSLQTGKSFGSCIFQSSYYLRTVSLDKVLSVSFRKTFTQQNHPWQFRMDVLTLFHCKRNW